MRDALPAFESPAFVERLDVLFAEFYFQAFDAAAAQAWVSKAWEPLFDRRDERGHPRPPVRDRGDERPHQQRPRARARADLARARPEPGRDSPEFRDYEKVNAILEAVEADIKGPLSDDLIASVDTLLGTTDDFLALWSIRRAREEAWKRARIMRGMPDSELDSLFDGFVGFAGNLLLRPSVLLG